MEDSSCSTNSNFQTEQEVPMNDSGYQDISFETPLFMSSQHEQKSMVDLNNRLAVYIEHVKNQENQANISKTLEEISEIPSIQLDNLKSTYEQEIDDLREALDTQSNSLASLTIANNKLSAENKNSKITIDNQAEKIQKLTESANRLELENATLNYQLNILKDNQSLSHSLADQLSKCQEQLEHEVLLRTSSDNACLTYKEKMEFNEAVFKKELGALMVTHKSTLKRMGSVQHNLSVKLYEEMEEERNKLKEYLSELQELIKENLFNTIGDAVDSISARSMHLSQLRSANDIALEDQHKLLMELDRIKASHVKLENQLSNIQTLNEEEIRRLNYFVKKITNDKIDDLETSFQNFQNLRDSICEKALIGEELAIYRKMLESEESRTDFQTPPTSKRSKIFREPSEDIANRKVLKAARRRKVCAIM